MATPETTTSSGSTSRRGDDLRVVRRPGRAGLAELDGRRRGRREPRHQVGRPSSSTRPRSPTTSRRAIERPRLRGARRRRPEERRPPQPDDGSRSVLPGSSSPPSLTVPLLLISMVPRAACSTAGSGSRSCSRPRWSSGRVAVPPGGARQPAARRRHDGHARVARHPGAWLWSVGRAACSWARPRPAWSMRGDDGGQRRRARLLRDGGGDRHAAPARAATSRPGPPPLGRRAARLARARREDGRASRTGDEIPVDEPRRSATASSCGRARRSRPTAWSSTARRRVDVSMLTGESVPVDVAPGDDGVRRDRQHLGPARGRGDPGRVATPRWPRSAASSAEAQGSRGAGAAAGRPHLERLRADRAR